MKTKIKRHSRSVISVILAVCMLVSCMTVGIIATNAAYLNGKPNGTAAANAADAGTAGAKADTASVGPPKPSEPMRMPEQQAPRRTPRPSVQKPPKPSEPALLIRFISGTTETGLTFMY